MFLSTANLYKDIADLPGTLPDGQATPNYDPTTKESNITATRNNNFSKLQTESSNANTNIDIPRYDIPKVVGSTGSMGNKSSTVGTSGEKQSYQTSEKGIVYKTTEGNLVEEPTDALLAVLTPTLIGAKINSGVTKRSQNGSGYNKTDDGQEINVGIDLYSDNKDVTPYTSGTVVSANTGYNDGWGNNILIKHNIDGKEYFSRYAHLDGIKVKAGDEVKPNTRIGLQGSTGKVTGEHLDNELFYNNTNGTKTFIKTDRVFLK
jgi:murein DD-endopeptidase MepM/ murein hydrolase activator NlpD